MSGFASALRSFNVGDLTQEELLSEVHRQLSVERVAPGELLEILDEHKRSAPLPDDTHETLLSRITCWPQDPTVVTRSSPERSSISRAGADAPDTIVLGDAAAPASGIKVSKGNRTPPVAVGSVLQGRFSLIALIGEGGMSRVYKAIDLRRVEAGAHDPYIAVKVLTVPFSHYFGSMAALQREAHKLQSLTHQNIVRVIDCDRDGQSVFMTMEYLPGESLYKRLRCAGSGGLPQEEAESIVNSIGLALEYAHRNQIVHGDLKPGNVIVGKNCDVKVIDFGMARFIVRPEGNQAQQRTPVLANEPTALTPRYASPEMLAGHVSEPADDVYALACIAYEVLTGRHPFGRSDAALGRDPKARPPQAPGLTRRQYRVLAKGLEFDRARRTPTVAQFLKEFRASNRDTTGKNIVLAGVTALLLAAAALILAPNDLGLGKVLAALPASANAPGTIIRDCPTCPLLTVLPSGRFKQGAAPTDPAAHASQQPQHSVAINYAIAMSVNEVTVGEFKEFVDATGRNMAGCEIYDGRWQRHADINWKNPGFLQSAVHPVTCVSWNDAAAYAQWLSRKSGRAYRLPSASEWEYAARASSGAASAWGAKAALACTYANVADQNAAQRFPGWAAFDCSDGYVETAPVGSFKSNPFGLNDMLGNVFEWVEDCWRDDYRGAPLDGSANLSGDCRVREARGGSWFTAPEFVSAAYRNRFGIEHRSTTVGFRVLRELGK